MKTSFALYCWMLLMIITTAHVHAQSGDDCSTIIDLTALSSPQTYNTCSATGGDIMPAPTCISAFGSLIFRIDVPDGQNLRIRGGAGSFTLMGASLRVGGACPGTTQLSCVTAAYNQNFFYANTTGVTQSLYYIIWNRFSFSCGDVTIDWEISPPVGDDCTEAIDLNMLSSPQSYYTCGNVGGDIAGTCIPNNSPSMVFTIDVPAGQQLNIRKPSDDFNSSHSLRVGGACPGTTEITCSTTDAEWSSYENTTAMPQTAYYLVWGDALTDCGTFNLEWHFSTPGGDDCANIVTFTGSSGSFTGSLAGFANDSYMSCAAFVNADFIAQIDVPDGHRLRVFTPVVIPQERFELRRGGACPGTTTVDGCYNFINATDLQYYDNSTGSTETIYVLVGGPENGPFQLDWEIDPLTAVPAGDDCSNPIDLNMLTSPIIVDNTNMVGNIAGHCHTAFSERHPYRDFVATITVPDGYRLQIRVLDNNMPTNPDVTLRWGGGCPGANEEVCFVDAPFISNTFDNTTGSPQEAYFVVSPWLSRQFGESELAWDLFPIPASPPANDDCAGAVDLTNPGFTESLYNQNVYDATNDALTCSPNDPDGRNGVWYKVIGNGCTMTASTSNFPFTNYDTEMALFEGSCAMLTCLDLNDENNTPFHTTNGTMNVGTAAESGGGSAVQWMSTAGTEYFIFVGQGPFNFRPVGDLQVTLSSDCPMGDNDFGNLDPAIWPPANATIPASGVQVWAGINLPDAENTTDINDDADGLIFNTTELIIGVPNPGAIQVILNTNTANTEMYYGLWFDWNNDGVFDDFYSGMATSPASGPFSVDVFPNVTPDPMLATPSGMYAARLVVSANPVPNTPGGSFINGEVEDFDTPITLPIELLTFETRYRDCETFLYWETATERNVRHYQIEASKDGRHFAPVGIVTPATANSDHKQTYSYAIDQTWQNHYFRLQSVDLDKSFEYSPVIFVPSRCTQHQPEIHLYPNPNTTAVLQVEINSILPRPMLEIIMYDAYGRPVLRQTVATQPGQNLFNLDIQALPTGTYYLQAVDAALSSAPLRFVRVRL